MQDVYKCKLYRDNFCSFCLFQILKNHQEMGKMQESADTQIEIVVDDVNADMQIHTDENSVHSIFPTKSTSCEKTVKRKHNNENTPKRARAKTQGTSQKQCKLDFPACRVCLGQGSGLHYGVNSCESCKSFFRRCLTRKEEYKCSKNNDCPVTSSARGNCSGCRYKRCLEVGMSREAAQLGRYTLTRRTRTIMEAKGEKQGVELILPEIPDRQKPRAESAENTVVVSDGPELMSVKLKSERGTEIVVSPSVVVDVIPNVVEEQSTLEILMDLALIEKLMAAMSQIKPFGKITTDEQIRSTLLEAYERYTTTSRVFGKMAPLPKDEYNAVFESTGIDVDGRQEFLRQSALSCQPVLHSYIAFANAVPGFSNLSLEDQCSLLKKSHFEVFLLLTYRGYDPDLQMILTETGKAYHLNQAADIFYSRNLIMSIFDVCKKIQLLELSKEETACLVAISVTFGDRCQLEDEAMVDDIQLRMVKTFRSLLMRSRPGEASRFFTKCVDCFIAMRAVADQYLKEYDEICQDKLVQKEAPIWLAYINANNVEKAKNEAEAGN